MRTTKSINARVLSLQVLTTPGEKQKLRVKAKLADGAPGLFKRVGG
ncbi:hypothetical protein [Laspinema palackyanum]|nr:hypothetical protein [Laspinema sp. D2c]